MNRDTFYRLWFTLLMVGVLFVFGRSIFAQEEKQKPPPPRIEEHVEVKGKLPKPPPAITIDVYPKIVLINPYRRTTFRVRIRIEEDDRNRIRSYSADCGSNVRSSQRGIDSITETWFEEMIVAGPCYFQACVHRVERGKVKNYCAWLEVKTPEQPP